MLTYDFENAEGPLYLFIYNRLKQDIISGKLKAGEKLPSKRAFAGNNGIGTITIQNAYDQLVSEGYVFTRPKRGYYVSEIAGTHAPAVKSDISHDIRVMSEKAPLSATCQITAPTPIISRFRCGQRSRARSCQTGRRS